MFPSCLRSGAVVVPVPLLGLYPSHWSRSKGGDQSIVRWSCKVVRQMPQRQVDDIAVVRALFARCLRQVEPEAVDQLHIVLGELGSVGPKVKDVRLAVRGDDAKAELPPGSVLYTFPGVAELPGLLHWSQHRRTAGDNLD